MQSRELYLPDAKGPVLSAKEEWVNSNVPRSRFDRRSNESNLSKNWEAIDSTH